MGVQSLHPQLNLPLRYGNGDLELEGNRNQAKETPQPRGHNAHRRWISACLQRGRHGGAGRDLQKSELNNCRPSEPNAVNC